MGTEALSDGWPRLRQSEALGRLLTHYADLGAADREAWQDRRMALEGVESRELVRLHGQLIACGWLEQNTGATPVLRPGVVAMGGGRIRLHGPDLLRLGADAGLRKPFGRRALVAAVARALAALEGSSRFCEVAFDVIGQQHHS